MQVDRLTDRNSSLLKHVAEAEGANAAIRAQIENFDSKLRATMVDSNVLQQQIAFLQEQQQVSRHLLQLSCLSGTLACYCLSAIMLTFTAVSAQSCPISSV